MASGWRRALSTVAHALTRIFSAPTYTATRTPGGGSSRPATKPPAVPPAPAAPVPPVEAPLPSMPPPSSPPALGGRSRPPIRVLTTEGMEFLPDLTDREASAVGRHWNAVRDYLDYGHDRELAEFEGHTVAGFELETRTNAIEWHAVRGEVRFGSIYDEVL